MKKYVFKPYSDIFPKLFQKEKERIALKITDILHIEHIGSTAVPGLGGKGIIDIGIAVDKDNLKNISDQLQKIGYEFKPAGSTLDRFFFITKIYDSEENLRSYHLHLTYPENNEWTNFLKFRDYLKTHPEALREYTDLKKQAVLEANDEGEKYRKIKQPIFEKVLKNDKIDQ